MSVQEHSGISQEDDTSQQFKQATLEETLPPLKPQPTITLCDADFDSLIEYSNTQQEAPARLKQAAELLDKEGF